MGVVERGAEEIVHARVDDDEGLGLAMLQIDHARDQHAGVADDEAARLQHQLAVQGAEMVPRDLGVTLGVAGLLPVSTPFTARNNAMYLVMR